MIVENRPVKTKYFELSESYDKDRYENPDRDPSQIVAHYSVESANPKLERKFGFELVAVAHNGPYAFVSITAGGKSKGWDPGMLNEFVDLMNDAFEFKEKAEEYFRSQGFEIR